MARQLQVTIDAIDPGRLAAFWAQVLGYQLDPPPEGHASWPEFLASIGVPESEFNARSACSDPEGVGPRLFFQRVERGQRRESVVHLDVTVAPPSDPGLRDAIEAEAARLEALGGRRRRVIDRPGEFWIVMEDPEGNAFCLQ